MADSAAAIQIFAQGILYEMFRRSVWVNVGNRMWESTIASAKTGSIPELTPNIQIDSPADRDALAASPQYTTASLDKQDWSREFLRATSQMNLLDEIEAAGGATLNRTLMEHFATNLALELDEKVAAKVTGSTFNAANDNAISVGTAGDTFIGRAFPYPAVGADGAGLKLARDGINQAFLKLFEKNVVGGRAIGVAGPSQVAALMPVGVANNLVDYLESVGELSTRASIAGQAVANRGILASTAFMGRYANIDIVATTSLDAPTGTDNWDMYVMPTMSVLAVGAFAPTFDVARFGSGNTAGQFIERRTAIQRWGAKVVRPEHIIRVRIEAD